MAWRTVVHWLEPFLGEREQLALGARGTLGGDHRDRGARLGGESQAAGRHEVTGRAKRQESEHVGGVFTGSGGLKMRRKKTPRSAPCWWPVEMREILSDVVAPKRKSAVLAARKLRDNERHA